VLLFVAHSASCLSARRCLIVVVSEHDITYIGLVIAMTGMGINWIGVGIGSHFVRIVRGDLAPPGYLPGLYTSIRNCIGANTRHWCRECELGVKYLPYSLRVTGGADGHTVDTGGHCSRKTLLRLWPRRDDQGINQLVCRVWTAIDCCMSLIMPRAEPSSTSVASKHSTKRHSLAAAYLIGHQMPRSALLCEVSGRQMEAR
jgi:hypothetical protein